MSGVLYSTTRLYYIRRPYPCLSIYSDARSSRDNECIASPGIFVTADANPIAFKKVPPVCLVRGRACSCCSLPPSTSSWARVFSRVVIPSPGLPVRCDSYYNSGGWILRSGHYVASALNICGRCSSPDGYVRSLVPQLPRPREAPADLLSFWCGCCRCCPCLFRLVVLVNLRHVLTRDDTHVPGRCLFDVIRDEEDDEVPAAPLLLPGRYLDGDPSSRLQG